MKPTPYRKVFVHLASYDGLNILMSWVVQMTGNHHSHGLSHGLSHSDKTLSAQCAVLGLAVDMCFIGIGLKVKG